jgi:hypothetical protein
VAPSPLHGASPRKGVTGIKEEENHVGSVGSAGSIGSGNSGTRKSLKNEIFARANAANPHGVLGQAPTADLREAPPMLHHVAGMLGPRAHATRALLPDPREAGTRLLLSQVFLGTVLGTPIPHSFARVTSLTLQNFPRPTMDRTPPASEHRFRTRAMKTVACTHLLVRAAGVSVLRYGRLPRISGDSSQGVPRGSATAEQLASALSCQGSTSASQAGSLDRIGLA